MMYYAYISGVQQRRAQDPWNLKGSGGNRPAPFVSTRAKAVHPKAKGGVRVVCLQRFEWTLQLKQQHQVPGTRVDSRQKRIKSVSVSSASRR